MAVSPPRSIAPEEAQQLKELLGRMLRIRIFDSTAAELATAKETPGHVHSSVGQEAVGVGVCAALNPDDYALTTHRGHGHVLAKGADPKPMMAELFGRETGSNRGKGGSLHITDFSVGMLGAISILGENVPMGVGAAIGNRVRGAGRVTVVFFGEGSSSEGAVHESLNIAGIRKLPVVFVCEDNSYCMSTKTAEVASVQHPAELGAPYRIPTLTVDGNDVLAVREAAREAVERARSGGGPTLIDAKTYRHFAHNTLSPDLRPKEEVAAWLARDPIVIFRQRLIDLGVLTEDEAAEIERRTRAEIDEAVAFARASSLPDPSDATTDVYAPAYVPPPAENAGPETEVTFREAIRQALAHEMERDPSVIVMGTSVNTGGSFGTTAGLVERHGADRALTMPAVELAMAGAANGAALVGCRAVVDFGRMDFVGLAIDQMLNLSSKLRHMTGGQTSVPVVFRQQWGTAGRLAQTHSQSLEAWYYHIPGLKLATPSTPADARGLLLTAIRDDNPVVFLEHAALQHTTGSVPASMDAIPFGQAVTRRVGEDLTLIGWGLMARHALAVAEILSAEGVSAEVVDPRTLVPLDLEMLVASAAKTGRVVICQDATLQGGVGSDIARQLYGHLFSRLKAPIDVTGAAWSPIPYAPVLEAEVVPGQRAVLEAARRALAG